MRSVADGSSKQPFQADISRVLSQWYSPLVLLSESSCDANGRITASCMSESPAKGAELPAQSRTNRSGLGDQVCDEILAVCRAKAMPTLRCWCTTTWRKTRRHAHRE